MATLARQLGAERIDAVATSAVRDATNAGSFLARDSANHRAQGARARRRGRGAAQLPQRRRALRHGRRPIRGGRHRRRIARAGAHRRRRDRATRLPALRRDSADRGVSSRRHHAEARAHAAASGRRRHSRAASAARLARLADHRLGRDVHEPRRHLSRAAGNSHGALGPRGAHSARRSRAHSRHARRDDARGATRRCRDSTRSAPTSSSPASPSRPKCCVASRRARSSCRDTAFAKDCCSRRRASRRRSPIRARRAPAR